MVFFPLNQNKCIIVKIICSLFLIDFNQLYTTITLKYLIISKQQKIIVTVTLILQHQSLLLSDKDLSLSFPWRCFFFFFFSFFFFFFRLLSDSLSSESESDSLGECLWCFFFFLWERFLPELSCSLPESSVSESLGSLCEDADLCFLCLCFRFFFFLCFRGDLDRSLNNKLQLLFSDNKKNLCSVYVAKIIRKSSLILY